MEEHPRYEELGGEKKKKIEGGEEEQEKETVYGEKDAIRTESDENNFRRKQEGDGSSNT